MDWFRSLFFESGVAQSIFAFALVIAIGVSLGKLKIKGISIGITWVLFVGIVVSHFGVLVDPKMLLFAKEFGLVLFIYSVGLQVGPSFFSSFRKGGLSLNMLALLLIFLGVLVTYIIHLLTDISISTMVGVMSGAVTNTPGLGAAQHTYFDIAHEANPDIALGYAVAYPMGVMGIILTIILLKIIFKVDFNKEDERVLSGNKEVKGAIRLSLIIRNPAIYGKTVSQIQRLSSKHISISRILHSNGNLEVPTSNTIFQENDKILVILDPKDEEFITIFIGEKIDNISWRTTDSGLEARRIMVTNANANGETIAKLGLYGALNFNITRVNRAGLDLVAHGDFHLQLGDRVTAVGTAESLQKIESILGNSMHNLRHPNILPVFLGIAIGVLVGSIPFTIPGVPQAVKLGLAGGPLIVSILISRFGPSLKLATYATVSANLMIREIGMAIFLAAVGLSAGETFVPTILNGGHYWVLCGIAITLIPAISVGVLAMKFFKIDYFTTIGLISGSTTNPPALAYSNTLSTNDLPTVSYSTVYPLSMFFRILVAQALILFLM